MQAREGSLLSLECVDHVDRVGSHEMDFMDVVSNFEMQQCVCACLISGAWLMMHGLSGIPVCFS